ncbi:hypothetical protein HHK36_020031 [Tetracentron sinense]|uniref:Uncharacterized protein n=1 Tax=Tetracentron sinense TaxID=13715 RepID=A0A834YWJ9_TETSI|nr:hypothetical protein HHK36_020031 [Tetracentron sinense]
MGANLEKLQQANGPINGESGREYSVSIPSLEDSIREKLNTLPPSLDELCIYRVSEILRKASESSYSPQLVSIGPFHRDNKNLGKMDVHKRRYLKTYLDSYCQINLQSCLQNLRDLEGRTRKCYVEHISLNSDQFVEMMLFDGVFIIMFLLKFYSPEIGDEDPIIKNMSMSGAIQYDMILLENQLPFFVLDHLFSLAQNTIQGGNIDGSQVKHILDLLRSCCIPSSLRPIHNVPYSRHSTVTELHYSRLSVTELHDVGVKTESLFRNLIALEQCHYPESAYVTGYALFMGYLINTPKVAGILIDHEIIKNYLGNHEDVSTFINNLSKHVVLDNTSSYFEYQELDEYCKKSLHRWSTYFRRTYYGSPIIIISTIAAILLLGLTVIQAICSIISVKVPKKS